MRSSRAMLAEKARPKNKLELTDPVADTCIVEKIIIPKKNKYFFEEFIIFFIDICTIP